MQLFFATTFHSTRALPEPSELANEQESDILFQSADDNLKSKPNRLLCVPRCSRIRYSRMASIREAVAIGSTSYQGNIGLLSIAPAGSSAGSVAIGRANRLSPRSVEGRWPSGSSNQVSPRNALGRASLACKASSVTAGAYGPSGRDTWSSAKSLGSSEGYGDDDDEYDEAAETPAAQRQNQYLDFPGKIKRLFVREDQPDKVPMVKVRLSVHFKCTSPRQMLCIGGSNIPFGWSFLSIAKVPMSWSEGDNWTAEVEVPLGTRLEYKYVILEEQDWTKQENEDAEGVVTQQYTLPEIPDVQSITKRMAIVAWQPGPNRMLVVPKEEEFEGLVPGESRKRDLDVLRSERPSVSSGGRVGRDDIIFGIDEAVELGRDSTPCLNRKDVWGYGDFGQRQTSPSRFGD
eukprot:scaffold37202_cov47-Prasinocladus_malaysianus.AAC.2